MRIKLCLIGVVGLTALLTTGCAGPERKLGRGINNFTEFARAGELRRTVEQTALWDGPPAAYTTGILRGMKQSMIRTLVGAYEIATFPFPSYDPVLGKDRPGRSAKLNLLDRAWPEATVDPTWPDSYVPKLISDTTFEPDAALGFSGGDVAPFVPGSRFRIFDY